jgi:uncharacterized protein with FMN-binding domain
MLLSFKTHAVPTTVAAPPSAVSGPTTSTSTPGPAATTGGATSTTAAAKTVTGNAASTRYGPVQVQITITNGRISAVDAIDYPTQKSRDREINARAIPQLDRETLAAQSARIDTISGATYTSTGYVTSLQSALNKAGLT